MESEA
jgi:hypothetical protein